MATTPPSPYEIGYSKDKKYMVHHGKPVLDDKNMVDFMFINYLDEHDTRKQCIAGFIDSHAFFDHKNPLSLSVQGDEETLFELVKHITVPHFLDEAAHVIKFQETNTLDLAFQYPDTFIYRNLFPSSLPVCGFFKMSDKAVTPTKARGSDVGYDVSIIDIDKVINDTTMRYTTSLQLDIPAGYYVQVVARSSLSNYGYVLSNSVGIIDRSYTGPLLITLTKVSSKALPIEFPFKCCQLIFQKQEFVAMKQIANVPRFNKTTSRGSKGHGSSDTTV